MILMAAPVALAVHVHWVQACISVPETTMICLTVMTVIIVSMDGMLEKWKITFQ